MTAGVGSTEQVQGHPAIRTLLLTRAELSAWLLDQRTGETRHLNNSAAAVWALLDRPATVDELVGDLAELVGLDPSTADEIVVTALDVFREAGLLDGDHEDTPDPDVPDPDVPDPDVPDPQVPDPQVTVPQRLARPPDP